MMKSVDKPNLILVDDHIIFRRGLKSIITIENIATVIGEASNGVEFIELLSYLKPDLVILDIDMPEMNGLTAMKLALVSNPNLKIIAFTMFNENDYMEKMRMIGAKGYLLKSGDISELETAIKLVMKGGEYFINNE